MNHQANWKKMFIAGMVMLGGAFASPQAWAEYAFATEQQQTGTCSGVVLDDAGEPLIGASVKVVGTQQGVVTDMDGKFAIKNVAIGSTIVVSYIGHDTKEMAWNGSDLSVVLPTSANSLDEVVVIGFGVQKKADLTGAVSQVKMDDVIGDRPVINAANALQGAMPGLQVSGGSSPGQAKSFNIRGDLSINGGSPLVLIDNVEGDVNALNPDDIESVTVLKDAASAAIYGARAAGGVILITTKRPSNDAKFSISYAFNQGWERSINRMEQTSLDNYIAAYEEAGYSSQYWAGNGHLDRWKELLGQYRNGTLANAYENGIFQDEDGRVYYLKEGDVAGNALGTGALSNHNISVTGGTPQVRFRMSANYSYENGPMITNKDKYTRKAISAFVSADIAKWYTQEINMYYTDTNKSSLTSQIRDPFNTRLVNYYPEGYYPKEILGTENDMIIDSPRNAYLYCPTATLNGSIPRIQVKAQIKPLDGWTITGEYTFNRNDNSYSAYSGVIEYADVQKATKKQPTGDGNDWYRIYKETTKYNALNIYTNYNHKWGAHDFGAMLGYNQESYDYSYLNTQVLGQAVVSVPSFGGGTGTKTLGESYSQYSIRGAFGRLTYNYDDRYLLTVNARYDGSSKFPKSNRYGFFPSASVGWRLGKEKFMEWSRNFLNEFKIRASYGSIGNQNIDPYGYVAQMSVGESTVWLNGDNKVNTIGVPGLIRANYTWEKVNSFNIGLDYAFFNNRLNGMFEWYSRMTKGMLADGIELPSVVGASAPMQNIADMRTNGWELTINWQDRIGKVGYRIGLNVYDHMSKITKFNNVDHLLSMWYEGENFNQIWGYVADGYYSIDDFEPEQAKKGQWILKDGVVSIQGYTVQPGDMKFKDLDGNGVINTGANTESDPGDRKVIGNKTSRYQFGANLGVNYGGFDLNVLLQGVGKRDVWLGSSAIFPFGAAGSDGVFWPVYYNQTDYWQAKSYDPSDPDYMVPVNPDAQLFRIYGGLGNSGSNSRVSDKYLSNGAYLRIKNITLSYSVPTALIKRIYLSQLRFYVSVENLHTFTSLPKGYDPENLSYTYPFYRTWSFGANVTF